MVDSFKDSDAVDLLRYENATLSFCSGFKRLTDEHRCYISESPGAFHGFPSLEFAFYHSGTRGCWNEFGKIRFGQALRLER